MKVPKPVFRDITKEELLVDDKEQLSQNITDWSKDLSELPPIRQSFIKDYLVDETISVDNYGKGANKHKINGYKLFKDNYVKDVKVKSNINAAEVIFIIKSFVTASMKRIKYIVYVHLSQETGKILYGKCTCKAGAGGCCKHVAAVLYQLCEYKELDLKIVPDDKTCTEILQTWNIPGETKNNKAILFSDLIFEKADAEKDKNNTRKRPLVTGKRDYCSYPSHEITSHEKIQKLCTSLESLGQGLYMATLLRGNDFTSCDLFHTSTTNTKQVNKFALEDNSPTRQPVLEILATLSVMPLDNTNLTEDQETLVKKYLNVSVENLISIEKNTLHQSNCQMWYRERSIRLTASNFGAVLSSQKRNISNITSK